MVTSMKVENSGGAHMGIETPPNKHLKVLNKGSDDDGAHQDLLIEMSCFEKNQRFQITWWVNYLVKIILYVLLWIILNYVVSTLISLLNIYKGQFRIERASYELILHVIEQHGMANLNVVIF